MKRFKKKIAGLLCAVGVITSLSLPSVYAEDIIAPTTSITDSYIDMLNIKNNIYNYSIGSGDASQNSVIQPITVIDDVNAALVNIINTIVNVNVAVDLSDMGSMITGLKADLIANMYK